MIGYFPMIYLKNSKHKTLVVVEPLLVKILVCCWTCAVYWIDLKLACVFYFTNHLITLLRKNRL